MMSNTILEELDKLLGNFSDYKKKPKKKKLEELIQSKNIQTFIDLNKHIDEFNSIFDNCYFLQDKMKDFMETKIPREIDIDPKMNIYPSIDINPKPREIDIDPKINKDSSNGKIPKPSVKIDDPVEPIYSPNCNNLFK